MLTSATPKRRKRTIGCLHREQNIEAPKFYRSSHRCRQYLKKWSSIFSPFCSSFYTASFPQKRACLYIKIGSSLNSYDSICCFDFCGCPPVCSYAFLDCLTGSNSFPNSGSLCLVVCSGLFCLERFFMLPVPPFLVIQQNHVILQLLQLQSHTMQLFTLLGITA